MVFLLIQTDSNEPTFLTFSCAFFLQKKGVKDPTQNQDQHSNFDNYLHSLLLDED